MLGSTSCHLDIHRRSQLFEANSVLSDPEDNIVMSEQDNEIFINTHHQTRELQFLQSNLNILFDNEYNSSFLLNNIYNFEFDDVPDTIQSYCNNSLFFLFLNNAIYDQTSFLPEEQCIQQHLSDPIVNRSEVMSLSSSHLSVTNELQRNLGFNMRHRGKLIFRTLLILSGSIVPLLFEMSQMKTSFDHLISNQSWTIFRASENPNFLIHDITIQIPSICLKDTHDLLRKKISFMSTLQCKRFVFLRTPHHMLMPYVFNSSTQRIHHVPTYKFLKPSSPVSDINVSSSPIKQTQNEKNKILVHNTLLSQVQATVQELLCHINENTAYQEDEINLMYPIELVVYRNTYDAYCKHDIKSSSIMTQQQIYPFPLNYSTYFKQTITPFKLQLPFNPLIAQTIHLPLSLCESTLLLSALKYPIRVCQQYLIKLLFQIDVTQTQHLLPSSKVYKDNVTPSEIHQEKNVLINHTYFIHGFPCSIEFTLNHIMNPTYKKMLIISENNYTNMFLLYKKKEKRIGSLYMYYMLCLSDTQTQLTRCITTQQQQHIHIILNNPFVTLIDSQTVHYTLQNEQIGHTLQLFTFLPNNDDTPTSQYRYCLIVVLWSRWVLAHLRILFEVLCCSISSRNTFFWCIQSLKLCVIQRIVYIYTELRYCMQSIGQEIYKMMFNICIPITAYYLRHPFFGLFYTTTYQYIKDSYHLYYFYISHIVSTIMTNLYPMNQLRDRRPSTAIQRTSYFVLYYIWSNLAIFSLQCLFSHGPIIQWYILGIRTSKQMMYIQALGWCSVILTLLVYSKHLVYNDHIIESELNHSVYELQEQHSELGQDGSIYRRRNGAYSTYLSYNQLNHSSYVCQLISLVVYTLCYMFVYLSNILIFLIVLFGKETQQHFLWTLILHMTCLVTEASLRQTLGLEDHLLIPIRSTVVSTQEADNNNGVPSPMTTMNSFQPSLSYHSTVDASLSSRNRFQHTIQQQLHLHALDGNRENNQQTNVLSSFEYSYRHGRNRSDNNTLSEFELSRRQMNPILNLAQQSIPGNHYRNREQSFVSLIATYRIDRPIDYSFYILRILQMALYSSRQFFSLYFQNHMFSHPLNRDGAEDGGHIGVIHELLNFPFIFVVEQAGMHLYRIIHPGVLMRLQTLRRMCVFEDPRPSSTIIQRNRYTFTDINDEELNGTSPSHLTRQRPSHFYMYSIGKNDKIHLTTSREESNPNQSQQTTTNCYVCMSAHDDAVMIPCMHGGCCVPCGQSVLSNCIVRRACPKCPLCRQPVKALGHLERIANLETILHPSEGISDNTVSPDNQFCSIEKNKNDGMLKTCHWLKIILAVKRRPFVPS